MILTITISKVKKWSAERNVIKLMGALQCNNEEIRKAAVLSLGQIGDRSAIDSLNSLLEREQDMFVKREVEKSIIAIQENGFDPVEEVSVIVPVSINNSLSSNNSVHVERQY